LFDGRLRQTINSHLSDERQLESISKLQGKSATRRLLIDFFFPFRVDNPLLNHQLDVIANEKLFRVSSINPLKFDLTAMVEDFDTRRRDIGTR
jgi:hypothetical protein